MSAPTINPPQSRPLQRATQMQTTPTAPARSPKRLSLSPTKRSSAHRFAIYGPGGVGKTSLAAAAPGPVVFFDLDGSLPVLLGDQDKVQAVSGCETWSDLLDGVRDRELLANARTVVIDSLTRAEQLAVAHTLATVKYEKGHEVKSLEGYGYGKGVQYAFDTFIALLQDLDALVRAGKNVILICNECTANVPNPAGDDFLRYEPRLQSPSSGKASIRLTVKEWVDHLLFIGYDVTVNQDGKAQGGGTRSIYPVELPHCMAKSRTLRDVTQYVEGGADFWAKFQ